MAHQLVCSFFPSTNIWQTSEQKISGLHSFLTHLVAAQWAGRYKVSRATKGGLGGSSEAAGMMGCDERGLRVNSVPSAWLSRLGKPPLICTKPTWPWQPPHRRTWQWQMRQCVEERGGRGEGGESRARGGHQPKEKLWLTGDSALCQSGGGTPWPGHKEEGGAPLWVHTFTPGQIARHARESSPPISTQLLHPSSSPGPKKTRYPGRHRLPPDLFRSALREPRAALCHARTPSCARFGLHHSLKVCIRNGIKKGRRRKEFTFWYGKEKILSSDASRVHRR